MNARAKSSSTTEVRAVEARVRPILTAAFIYYVLARLGLLLAVNGTAASAMWPAAGAALASVVLAGSEVAWGIALGSWAANLMFLTAGHPPVKAALCAAAIAVGTAAQALGGKKLLETAISARRPLERSRDVVLFSAMVPLACLISASVGTASLIAAGLMPKELFVQAWSTWWVGDVVGVFVVFPLAVYWFGGDPEARRPARALEMAVSFLLIALSCWLGFGERFSGGSHYPLSFLPFPALVWTTMRLEAPGVTAGTAFFAVLIRWWTIHGKGPFAFGWTIPEKLFLSTLYLGAAAATSYLLHAFLAERRAAEERYRRSQDVYLRTMIESIEDYAIFRIDAQGRVASWNQGAQKIAGYKSDEILGRPFDVLFTREDAAAGRPSEMLRQAAATGREESEGWRRRKDGTLFWTDSVVTALREADGSLQGYVKVARDATERRRLELSLEARSEELARSNAELGEFAYVAAHDLQEPLRKIAAFAGQLRAGLAGRLNETEADFMSRMLGAVDAMQNLIDALLRLARVSVDGKAMGPVDLSAVARAVLEGLSVSLAESGGRVEVGPLPVVEGDSGQMRQLLQNLLSNAIKFHAPGRPPTVRVDGRDLGHGRCEIRVQDDGVGFDMRYAQRLFQPLQRLHSRMDYPGTGMGLAICKKIVERHGGALSVESAVGRGAIFMVVLPAARSAAVPAGGASWNSE